MTVNAPGDRQAGYLDLCVQSHCAGWAVEDRKATVLSLFINDVDVARIECTVARPDLAAHGLPALCGFSHSFDRPLHATDVVDVRFSDGTSLGASPSAAHKERLEMMLEGVVATEPGLEIGPLDRPILGKPDYQVRYVDHASREDLIEKYKLSGTEATVQPDHIRDVDVVWHGRLLDLAGGGYSYCLASHVIEHIADPIGWLIEIAEVLKPGGRLNLAVPDRARTFDYRRQPSIPAALLEAHQRQLKRPSFGQIFDHVSGVSQIGEPVPDPVAAARNAYALARLTDETQGYVDVHCHVWTHESFSACWAVIDALGLVPLQLARITPPVGTWNEFIVSFVRKPDA